MSLTPDMMHVWELREHLKERDETITRLRAEVERLRAALKWINEPGSSLAEVINHARTALGDTHE